MPNNNPKTARPKRRGNKPKQARPKIQLPNKPKTRIPPVMPPGPHPSVYMSDCAKKYSRCLANPTFSGPLACVPSQYPNRSLKQRVWAKGSFALSSAQAGWILLDPARSCFNDSRSVLTNSNIFGSGDPINTNATNLSIQYNTNSQYSLGDLSLDADGVAYRVVGSMLRIAYAGTELNKSGYTVGLHDPTHTTLAGQTLSDLDAEPQSKRNHVTREWTSITYNPVVDTDYEFNGNPFPASSVPANSMTDVNGTITGSTPHYYMGFHISASAPATFEFEAWTVVEYQGRHAIGQTVSPADTVGAAAAVTTAMSSRPSTVTPQQQEQNFLDRAAGYIQTGSSYVRSIKNLGSSAYKFGEGLFGESGMLAIEGLAAM